VSASRFARFTAVSRVSALASVVQAVDGLDGQGLARRGGVDGLHLGTELVDVAVLVVDRGACHAWRSVAAEKRTGTATAA
jgi:hypothetical protein